MADINFAQKDPDAITQEVISAYELYTGRTLARADPVRLFLNGIILAFIHQRNAIDHAAKMNLLAYASGDYLDHLGALLGVRRLEASKASCTVKFSLSAPQSYSIDIPAGTRVTPNREIYFETTGLLTLNAGETEAITVCTCTEAGEQGNGFMPDQITRLVDVFPYEMSCTNLSVSYGGTDIEDDESFRERIHLAPESFTNAGSIQGYEYYARSADPNIIDVAVEGPPETEPGCVNIYVLMKGGALPDDDTLAKVLAACSAEDIRPDTDYVAAIRPEVIESRAEVRYWIDAKNSAEADTIERAVERAVQSWMSWQGGALGRDINPSRLSHDILDAGACRCDIIAPEFTALSRHQVSKISSYILNFAGLE